MTKRTFKLLLLLLLSTRFVQAQTTDTLICDAPDRDSVEFANLPYYANNAYLQNFLDSIGYPAATSRIIQSPPVRYHVPIKFWIYRSTAGIGGPDIVQLQNYIANLNRLYNVDNNTLIGFYMRCEIGFVDDDSHLVINNDLEALTLLQAHKERGCINIHITNTLNGNAVGVQYRARFFGIDGIFLSSPTYTRTDLFSTIAHEVGHYFELDHTHQYNTRGKCRKEAIDRNRNWPLIIICPLGGGGPKSQKVCEATGDGLMDTPADPELNGNTSCTFNAGGNYSGFVDPWGDHYITPPAGSAVPDTRNIMSYNGNRACRVVFSRLQIAVMLHSIVRGKSNGNRTAWEDARGVYDEYEMDNFPLTAKTITLPDIQDRNFHQQYLGDGLWSQCDVDWVRFVAPCTANIFIGTAEIPEYSFAKANTRLTLFDASATTQLAQNDDISLTNQFSSINFNFVGGQTYFIRVENMTNLNTGYYRLRFSGNSAGYTLNGTSTLCTTALYSIAGLPAGSTVTWSTIPAGFAGIATDPAQQATLTKTNSGDFTLNATVSTAACGTSLNTFLSKAIHAGGYSSSDYPVNGPSSACKNSFVSFSTNTLPGATSYTWFWPGGWTSASGQGTPNLSVRTNTVSGQVGVRVANACDAGGSPGLKFVQVNTFCGSAFRVSPNPAIGIVTISPPVNTVGAFNMKPVVSSQNRIFQVKIMDQAGNIRKQYRFAAGASTADIDVSNLMPGIYTIQIFNGTEWVPQKLIRQ